MPGSLESEQCIYEGMLTWDRDSCETRIIHLIHRRFLSTYDVPGTALVLKLNGECNRHELYPHGASREGQGNTPMHSSSHALGGIAPWCLRRRQAACLKELRPEGEVRV